MNKIQLIGAFVALSGCGGMTIQSIYGGMTSGVIGCDAKDIKISNFKTENLQSDDSWVAECKGKKFYCTYHDVISNSAGQPACAAAL